MQCLRRIIVFLSLLTLLIIGSYKGVEAEWVEIPQFSDYQKVYRSPVAIRNQQHQQQQQQNNRRIFDIATEEPVYYGHKIYIKKEPNLRNLSGYSGNRRPTNFPVDGSSFVGSVATFTTERIQSSIIEENEDDNGEIDTDEGIQVEPNEEDEEQEGEDDEQVEPLDEPPIAEDEITETFDPMETTTTAWSFTDTTNDSQSAGESNNDNKSFFDYLPIDLLKRVHQILKSQPQSINGKMRYLKTFDRTLMSEIQSRLSEALAPSRISRQARTDDGEDGIGFPSLEGTLMAISFLTFAVYLVRLVMMLFRNAGNVGTTPVFIGRKRRSVDDVNEETARILSYLDSALPHQS